MVVISICINNMYHIVSYPIGDPDSCPAFDNDQYIRLVDVSTRTVLASSDNSMCGGSCSSLTYAIPGIVWAKSCKVYRLDQGCSNLGNSTNIVISVDTAV